MTYTCPRGHPSTEADYCSECGIRMAPKAAVASAPTAATVGECPVCGTPRVEGARFCEVCRHDFTGAAPSAPAPTAPAPTPPASMPPASMPPASSAPFAAGNFWAVVTADKSLLNGSAGDVVFPDNEPTRAYPLDLDENLVGRRNARPHIHPEIPIGDASVSSRHLKICRRKDGSLYLVDVGSSNGTKLNATAIEAGVETPLNPGDQIVIGAWTRITIEAR